MKKTFTTLLLVAFMVSTFFVGSLPANAQDVSVEDLLAQIEALQAKLQALQGEGVSSSLLGCEADFTQDLSSGMSGAQAKQVQLFLNNQVNDVQVSEQETPGGPGAESDLFGLKTKAAVQQFQNMFASEILVPVGLTNGTGYWGPSTRAKANAMCDAALASADENEGGQTTDEKSEDGDGTAVTHPTDLFESDDTVGYLENYEIKDGNPAQEQVYRGQTEQEVFGFEFDAVNGPVVAELLNVTVSGEEMKPWDFFKDITLWYGGEKIGYVPTHSSRFWSDEGEVGAAAAYVPTANASDDLWTTQFGNMNRRFEERDDHELFVAFSIKDDLDSGDVPQQWNIFVDNVGFRVWNAGETLERHGNEGPSGIQTFTVQSGGNTEYNVSLDADSPQSQVIDVDTSNDTENVEMLRFTLEAEGDSDLRVRDLPITFATGSSNTGDVEDIINSAKVIVDGEEFSESVNASALTNGVLTFDDFDHTIDAGDTVEVVVEVDVNDTGSSFVDGDTLKASYTSTNRGNTDVEDSSGEDLDSGDRTGTANGEDIAFYEAGVMISLVETSTGRSDNDGADNDTATFEIKYEVTAFDTDVYISDSASSTDASGTVSTTSGTNAIVYQIDQAGTAISGGTGLSGVVNFSDNGNTVTDDSITNGVKITEGTTAEFTLSVTRTNSTSSDDGQYRASLKAISWGTSDATHTDTYNFNFDEFQTDYIFIN